MSLEFERNIRYISLWNTPTVVFIFSNIDSKNRSVGTLFWCFFVFFVHCNEQVCSFLIVESLSEFCIGNFICISGITCELIVWCGCISSVYIAILVSGCPACGPDVVLEFSARVGGWWAQGAERIGVDEKFGKHFAQHSDRSPSVHDICEVETVVPHV